MGALVVQLRLPSFTDADVSLVTAVPSSTDSSSNCRTIEESSQDLF